VKFEKIESLEFDSISLLMVIALGWCMSTIATPALHPVPHGEAAHLGSS
jgi:hypothetical protein